MAGGLAGHVAGWAPEPTVVRGRLDPWPAAAFAALLDQPPPCPRPGDPLPPLWHVFHLLDHPAQSDLGEDGHPRHGRFLPPIPHRRRMFAGGRLEVREPLRVGDEVLRRSALASVGSRRGRSGEMVLVTVRHEILRDGAVLVTEEQDFAYRSQPAGTDRGLPAADGDGATGDGAAGDGAAGDGAAGDGAAGDGAAGAAEPWQLRLDPDAPLLFRFSALTYNTHRIHYDHPYVTGVEGYPGLVVHGPLLALLLLELPRRYAPDRAVTGFSYRLRRPVFAGSPVVARGSADAAALEAGVPGQPPAVTGSVDLR